jgi:hypothetical protein
VAVGQNGSLSCTQFFIRLHAISNLGHARQKINASHSSTSPTATAA